MLHRLLGTNTTTAGRMKMGLLLPALIPVVMLAFGGTAHAYYSFTGTITVGGSGLGGVLVWAKEATPVMNYDAQTTTLADGTYSFSNFSGGEDIIIRVYRPGYTFVPATRSLPGITTSNVTGQDFAATQFGVPPTYRFVALASGQGQYGITWKGFNNNGVAIGWGAFSSYSETRPYTWTPNANPLTGGYTTDVCCAPIPAEEQESCPDCYPDRGTGSDINDSKQMLTYFGYGTYTPAWVYSTIWSPPWKQIKGTYSRSASPVAINASGQLAGSMRVGSTDHAAFQNDYNSDPIDLGVLFSNPSAGSVGTDINDSGWVVGYSTASLSSTHAFLHDGTQMLDLGALPGTSPASEAYSVNNFGQAVGWSLSASSSWHAVMYDGGQVVDLGLVYPDDTTSYATSINDHGWVTGYGTRGYPSRSTNFVYDGRVMWRIFEDCVVGGIPSGWTGLSPVAINNKGWILCNGQSTNTQYRGCVLIPDDTFYFVTGTILVGGSPLANVTVTASGGHTQTVTTNAAGQYTVTGVRGTATNILLTPTRAGYSFAPVTRSVLGPVSANVSGQDFGGIPDTTPPNWVAPDPQSGTVTDTTAQLLVKIDEAGTAYFVCLPVGADMPTAAQVKAGQDAAGNPLAANLKGLVALAANTEGNFSATGLLGSTDYDFYLVAEDLFSNLQVSPEWVGVRTQDDTTPPTWASTYPKPGTVTDRTAQVLVKTNEAGASYFVCLPSGATAPTAAQVKAGQDASGAPLAANLKGSTGDDRRHGIQLDRDRADPVDDLRHLRGGPGRPAQPAGHAGEGDANHI